MFPGWGYSIKYQIYVLSIEFSDFFTCLCQISKKQHNLVKSMKQTGKSIESLNGVLGDLNNIHVQSYEVFIKDEQNKLHEHWLVCCLKHFFCCTFCYSIV